MTLIYLQYKQLTEYDKILRSEKGGKSAIDGFKYERDIIAFLSVRMYCNVEKIIQIVCEYKNDIEIMFEELGLCSCQIKKTDSPNLSKREILDSIKLFEQINKSDKYMRLILFCNKDLANTQLNRLELYSMSDLERNFPKFNLLQEANYDASFLSKLYFMKGPDLDFMNAIIKDEMICISNKEIFLNKLNSLIDHIWSGITYIQDKKIIDHSNSHNRNKEFKTINKNLLRNFETDINSISNLDVLLVNNNAISRESSISDFDESEVEELILDFNNPDLRLNVLQHLANLSLGSNIYRHKGIIQIMKSVTISNDKNELQQFFYIMSNMLNNSKEYDKKEYKCLIQIFQEYIQDAFISTEVKFRYPYLKVKDILEANFSSRLCELNWDRLKNFIDNDRFSEEEVMKYCINNMEYLKKNCDYNKEWKSFIFSCNRNIEFKNQIYTIIKFK